MDNNNNNNNNSSNNTIQIPSEMPSPNGDPVDICMDINKNNKNNNIITQTQEKIINNIFTKNNNSNEEKNKNNNTDDDNIKTKMENNIQNSNSNSEDIIMKNTNEKNENKMEIDNENEIKNIKNENNNININNNNNNNNIDTKLQTQQTENNTDYNNDDEDNNNNISEDDDMIYNTNNNSLPKRKYKKQKKRCAALDYLSDSPKKKRGRKVKSKKNLPPIQKQPFFLVFPDLRLKCPQCDHIAICQGTLVQHLRTHPTSRKCPECNKTFSTQQNLIKHARLHTGERPYPCPIAKCKWAYKQKGDLLAHIQRGKHGTSSDNNRKPPPQKFYHGSTKLPTLHAISRQDVLAAPDLKQLIVALRKREEMKKKQKEKVKQKRKNQLDDFVLSMFLSIYDIDNHEMKNLLKIAKTKYKEKMLKKSIIIENGINNNNNINESPSNESNISDNESNETIDIIYKEDGMQANDTYLKIDTLPHGKRVNIKFKYLVNRVYGDYSIVLVPVNSVPREEIYEQTPEIVIDPKLIPALQNDFDDSDNDDMLNQILNDTIPPPVKKQRLNNGGSNITKELSDNHIVLGKGNGLLGRAIGHMPRKRQYHKYNQTSEGYWQCDAPNCGSLFLSKEMLEGHCKELHDSGYYGCKYCERIYRSQKNVQNHLKKAHQKHGDEYLNALIYNKFNQIIKLKTSVWNEIKNKNDPCKPEEDVNKIKEIKNNDKVLPLPLPLPLPDINTFDMDVVNDVNDKLLIKSVIFKTHPLDNTILRLEHDSEKEDDDNGYEKLVPWTMQDKNKRSERGRGRPRRVSNNSAVNNVSTTPKKRGRPRGRPKGSKNKKKTGSKPVVKKGKRPRGRPKGSTNKKKRGPGRPRKVVRRLSISEESEFDESDSDEEYEYFDSLSEDEFSLSDYEIGTIYDDLEGDENDDTSDTSAMKDEKSILAQDIKLDKLIKQHTHKQNRRKMMANKAKKMRRGRKRKRNEISSDDGSNNNSDDNDDENDSEENDYIMKDNNNNNKEIRVKIEPQTLVKYEKSLNDISSLPFPDIANVANLGMGFNGINNINLPSIGLFTTPTTPTQTSVVNNLNSLGMNNTTLDIPMPAMPSINATTAEFNNLINQIQNGASLGNGGNNNNIMMNDMDMNSIIESLISNSSQRNTTQSTTSEPSNAFTAALSPINSIGSLGTMGGMNAGAINQFNTMNQLSQLSVVSNQLNNIQNSMNQRQRQNINNSMNIQAINNLLQSQNNNNNSTHSSEEPIHPINKNNKNNNNMNKLLQNNNNNNNNNGAMLNNYGNIVNNNYLLKQLNNTSLSQKSVSNDDGKDKNNNNNNNNNNKNKNEDDGKGNIDKQDDSESPFVPPLVEAVCGAAGCTKTKRDDGKPLLMCGRCFNIKYCSKRCQLAHIHDHRQICKKKGTHK